VRHFSGNVVALRRKAQGNVSLCATGPEVNILCALRGVSGTASDLVNDIMQNYSPPVPYKEVRVFFFILLKKVLTSYVTIHHLLL